MEKALVAAARAATGYSQTAFAKLLGVSVRTLYWEQGRKVPSGAATTLCEVVAHYPKVLLELAA